MRTTIPARFLIGAALLVAARGRALARVPPPDWSGPAAEGAGSIVLAEEAIRIVCDPSGACTIEARYRFENPGRSPGRLLIRRADPGLDHRPTRLVPNPGCALELRPDGSLRIEAEGFHACTLVLQAGFSAARRVIGQVGPGALGSRIFDFARQDDLLEHRFQIRTAEISRPPGARFQLVLRHPEGWRLTGRVLSPQRRDGSAWAPGSDAGLPKACRAESGSDTVLLTCRGCSPAVLLFRLENDPRPNWWLLDSGPFLGAGLEMIWLEDRISGWTTTMILPSARIGFEWAPLDVLDTSLALESDFRRRLTLVPALEAGLPLAGQPRLASLGVGAPISLLPRSRVGLRFQLRFSAFFVSVVNALDWVPGLPAGHPDHLVLHVILQLSL